MSAASALRPVAVDVVREAMVRLEAGGSRELSVSIRRRLRGSSRADRLRFEATLAWTAGLLAAALPPAERDAIFDLASSTDDELKATLMELVTDVR